MSAIVRKEGLLTGDVYLQRFGDEAAVDYWTDDPAQAHEFSSLSSAADWVRRLGIGDPVTVVELPAPSGEWFDEVQL